MFKYKNAILFLSNFKLQYFSYGKFEFSHGSKYILFVSYKFVMGNIKFNSLYKTVKCPFARIQLVFDSNFIHKLSFNKLHPVVCQGISLRVIFTFLSISIFQDLQLILFTKD